MDFNQSPYFDDFDETKQYQKVLFKPGVAVQTREMNQLQSILQSQVSKFGNHIFKDGSMVIPGNVQYNQKVSYIKLASTSLGGYSLDWLEGQILSTINTGSGGVEATVIKAIAATATDPITLIVVYTGGNQDDFGNDEITFGAGATIYVKDNVGYTVSMQGGDNVTGKSAIASQQSGVYYLGGYFVTVPSSTVVVEKYVTSTAVINAKIGIAYTEEIITYEDDPTLLDNAAGTSNVAAPGADRFKIATSFVKLGLDETMENFFELLRIEEGTIQQIINGSQYNILEQALAERTFDESGNYVVNDFTFDVRESRSNNRGTWVNSTAYYVGDYVASVSGSTTRYYKCIQSGISDSGSEPGTFQTSDETSSVSDGSVRWRLAENPVGNFGYYDVGTSVTTLGNSSNLVMTFGPGKAYIQGFEVNKLSNSRISIAKSRETQTDNNRAIAINVGNYAYVDPANTLGLPDVSAGPIVNFYDRIIGDNTVPIGYGNKVGTGRIMYIDGSVNSSYKVGLTDVVMDTGKYFERDVVMMMQDDPSATRLSKSYQLTGAVRYLGNDNGTSGWVQLSGGMQFVPNISAANDPTGFFSSILPGDTFYYGQGGNRDYLWNSYGNTSNGAFYQASTGLTAYAFASSTMAIRGYQTAFTKELNVGDIITTETSANATSSWTVVSIPSDTSLIVSGSVAFTRYKSTGWSTVVSNRGIVKANGHMMTGMTVTAGTVSNNTVIYNITGPAGSAFSSQLSIGSIVAFCNSSGSVYSAVESNIAGTYGGTPYFRENFEYPPHNGYSHLDYSASSMTNRLQQWKYQTAAGGDIAAGNLSSFMVIGWGNGATPVGLTIVGSYMAAVPAANSGMVVMLRGTDHAAVPASYNATTSYANVTTAAYVRVNAGTVFGVGTGTSTQFQSELIDNQRLYLGTASEAWATRLGRAITENRALVATATTSLTAYTSLSLINATTATQITSNWGAWYSGITASFAAEVFDSFSLGINAKRLSGLYQLLDANGSTGTATVHTAVKIVGDSTAKFTQQLRKNDMVKIDGNRIFITKISSNSIAFGISMDTSITGSTLAKPLLLVTNGLNQTENTTLLFKASDALSDVFDNSYSVYKTQQVNGVQGDSTVTIGLSGASGGSRAEQLATTNPTYFQVAEDTVNSLSIPLTVTNVSYISDTEVQLTINGTIASDRVRVIYPVLHGAVNDAVLGGLRTKTLTFDEADEFLSSSVAAKTSLALNQCDVLRVNKILMATEFVSSWNSTVQASALDVTNHYSFDNGQRDMFYGPGRLTLQGGRAGATGSIKVWYDYFEHSTGDFFAGGSDPTRTSYNPLQVPYEAVPTYNGESLNDYFDFRAKVDTATNQLIGNAIPRLDSVFQANTSRYLARKETIMLDRNGNFTSIPSASAIRPVDPMVAQDNGSLEMYTITLEPYTRSSEYPAISTRKRDYRRYTMSDIAGIDRRLTALEEISSLNLLEVKTTSLQVRDNADPTLERYKTGFFVDNFGGDDTTDPESDSAMSMDEVNQTLNPAVTYDDVPLAEKLNFSGAVLASLEMTPQVAARALDNYRVTGDLLTLNYTTSTFLSQTLATTSISVAPFLASNFIGKMDMTPSSDIWTSTDVSTKKVGDATAAENARNLQAAIARYTGNSRYRVVSWDAQRFIEQNTRVTEAPFCRANTVLIKVTGLKPNTKFYPFFDDTYVGPLCQGAHRWTLDAVSILNLTNSRVDSAQWAKWRTYAKSQWVEAAMKVYTGRAAAKFKVNSLVARPRQTTTNAFERTVNARKTFNPSQTTFETYLPAAANGDIYQKAFANCASMYYYAYSAYRGSAVIAHQDGTTLYTVNNRGYLSRGFLSTRTKVNNQGSYNYSLGSGTFYVAVDQNDPKYLTPNTVRESDVYTSGADGAIFSDSKGVLVALFDLPNTDSFKFLSGEKKFIITDSFENDPDEWESRAEGTYTAKGMQLTVTRNYISTKEYQLVQLPPPPSDPIAQSFKIPDQFKDGMFITDVDFFFQAKPANADQPVVVELRPCDASGRPVPHEAVPGTSVTLYPDSVNVDATRGQAATKFVFKQPVYLLPGKDYAIVMRSDSTKYRVWTATLGQADVQTPSKTYSTQATLGSLFKSQDATLWTEDQTSDLKFVMNRAVFTQSQATARVVNAQLPGEPLSNDPLMFVHGSNKIRVRQINHGHARGDFVRLSSNYWKTLYTEDSSVTINGIPALEIFGAQLTREDFVRSTDGSLTVSETDGITFDDYVIQVSTPANLGVAATTGVSAVMGGGKDVLATRNILYHAVTPACRVLSFPQTTLTMTAEQYNGFSYDDVLPNTTGNVYGRTTIPMDLNVTNFVDTPKIMLSAPNETSRTAGGTVGGGTGATTWKDSFVGEFTLATSTDALSPAIDLSTLVARTITHRIDNPTRAKRLPTTLPAIGTGFTGDILFVDYEPIVENNTSISFDGINEALVSATSNTFDDIIPGMYITVSGSSISGNNNTSTGLRVLDVSEDGSTVYVSGNLTSIGAGDAITVYSVKEFVEETGFSAGTALSKYITKKINLENPATSIKILIDANIPSAADFDVYYKIGSATENFDGFIWSKFDNMPNYNKEDKRGLFTEVQIDVTDLDDAGNAKDFPEFTAFQLKIVMRTSNAARVPQFKNLRVIAHA